MIVKGRNRGRLVRVFLFIFIFYKSFSWVRKVLGFLFIFFNYGEKRLNKYYYFFVFGEGWGRGVEKIIGWDGGREKFGLIFWRNIGFRILGIVWEFMLWRYFFME